MLRASQGRPGGITGFDINRLKEAAEKPVYDPWERKSVLEGGSENRTPLSLRNTADMLTTQREMAIHWALQPVEPVQGRLPWPRHRDRGICGVLRI